MKNLINIFVVIFLSTINLVAQNDLTISSAVKKTLENNLDIKISENLEKIAKNNSSILNNNYLPNIQLGSDISSNIQSIEIETPSGISGTLDDTKTDNSSALLSISYNIIDASGRKYNYKKSKELFSKSNLEVKEIIENTMLQLFTVFFEVGRLSDERNILKNALEKINQERLSLYHGDSLDFLRHTNTEYDYIYFDFMFEKAKIKSLASKHDETLRCIGYREPSEERLIQLAQQRCKKSVIVKGPKNSTKSNRLKPNHRIQTKLLNYDIFISSNG